MAKTTRKSSTSRKIAPPAASARRAVVGIITSQVAGGAAHLVVRAFSVDLKRSTLLGETNTDPAGQYSIAYVPAAGPVHIQVQVSSFAGQLLAISPVHFNAAV